MLLDRPSLFAPPVLPELGQADFEHAAHLLHARTGIVLAAHKREMTARMLGAHARKMGMPTIAHYLRHLAQNAQAPEWHVFINSFTVNHTAFFRERHHFVTLSEFARSRRAPISVWCCAASTGEEAYSIAMTLHEACASAESRAPVWATDIDTVALESGRQGIYTAERARPVPEAYLKKYFYRGRGKQAGMVRLKPDIRNAIEFEPFNLLSGDWPGSRRFDAIFCRNTMIYFDKATQASILERFARMLRPEGLLFVGHSENFTQMTQVFRLRGHTVYVRSD